MDKKGKPIRALLLFSVLFVFLSVLIVAVAVSGESPQNGSLTAIVKDELVPVRYGGADEAESRWPSRFPKHPELYVPMPLPEPTESVAVTQAESRLVSYNVITGEETVSEITHDDFPMAAWVEGGMSARASSSGELEWGEC